MKTMNLLIAAVVVAESSIAQAATRQFPVQQRMAYQDERGMTYDSRIENETFRVEVIGDNEELKPESNRNNRPFVVARPGERYFVRLYNPLPIQVAVNLTVDGLNSITGKPSGIADGKKWIIEPYGFVIIRGWQVNGNEARRFFFTDKPKSYAKWRGDRLGMNLSANCGVIGAAYFWNQSELNRYYETHPIRRFSGYRPEYDPAYNRLKTMDSMAQNATSAGRSRPAAAPSPVRDQKAGTGMGEREWDPTTEVAFNYDTGMYNPADAVVIYYDFAAPENPNPFPALSYAPEMP